MSDACPHNGADQPSGTDVIRAVDAAAARCAAAGERWTEPRRRTFELLAQAGRPVKAYDLIANYGGGKSTKPPTVYRALEFLESQGLAHRLESMNAYVACAGGHDHNHSAAFVICECCGASRELGMDLAQGVRPQAETQGFALRSVVLEAHGRCPACTVPNAQSRL
ncbi:MAG: transcriptional repressor [Phenylobacterium sp.]|uniref:Fur family transcriptional regulator n=1 Tax=Phenylobacterium sp. TaxID=1871053 RepID=UPI0012235937|nr:Fur family transcriptional regulator [Phenylobacterium sp.]TAJ71823.1 MAG: transcriptional repressor [Phenylobacterium sp.]